MGKFQVGDIVRRVNSPRLFVIRKSFEGFSQAQIYVMIHDKDFFNKKMITNIYVKTHQIDDLDITWMKEPLLIKNKFQLNEKVFFRKESYTRVKDEVVSGTIVGCIPEFSTYYNKITYQYYIKSDAASDRSLFLFPELTIIKNINANKLWNELNE